MHDSCTTPISCIYNLTSANLQQLADTLSRDSLVLQPHLQHVGPVPPVPMAKSHRLDLSARGNEKCSPLVSYPPSFFLPERPRKTLETLEMVISQRTRSKTKLDGTTAARAVLCRRLIEVCTSQVAHRLTVAAPCHTMMHVLLGLSYPGSEGLHWKSTRVRRLSGKS